MKKKITNPDLLFWTSEIIIGLFESGWLGMKVKKNLKTRYMDETENENVHFWLLYYSVHMTTDGYKRNC